MRADGGGERERKGVVTLVAIAKTWLLPLLRPPTTERPFPSASIGRENDPLNLHVVVVVGDGGLPYRVSRSTRRAELPSLGGTSEGDDTVETIHYCAI